MQGTSSILPYAHPADLSTISNLTCSLYVRKLPSFCSPSSSPPTAIAAMATTAVTRTYLARHLARAALVVKARVRTAARARDQLRARNSLARLLSLTLQRLPPPAPMAQQRLRRRAILRPHRSPLHGERQRGCLPQSSLRQLAGTHVSLFTQLQKSHFLQTL